MKYMEHYTCIVSYILPLYAFSNIYSKKKKNIMACYYLLYLHWLNKNI